jgi:hypothetical protein
MADEKTENVVYTHGRIYKNVDILEKLGNPVDKVMKNGNLFSVYKKDGELFMFMPMENGGSWYDGKTTQDKISRLKELSKYARIIPNAIEHNPELIFLPLVFLFPSILNIPLIKILMARRFGL